MAGSGGVPRIEGLAERFRRGGDVGVGGGHRGRRKNPRVGGFFWEGRVGRGEASVGGALLTRDEPCQKPVANMHACRSTGLAAPDAQRWNPCGQSCMQARKIVVMVSAGPDFQAR